MIVYAFFLAMLFIGFSFFAYGMMMEYQFYISLAYSLNLPSVVVPIGFYILIASAMFFLATPIAILIRVKQSGCAKRFDATPKNKGLFDFIYRDGDIRDVYGDRIAGLGLYRILKLGLIFDTGREPKPGSVYNIPGKKVRFALQDINFSPNAKIAGFYPYLTNLGFNNMNEVQDVLNGYNPELMVKVWNKLLNQEMKRPEDAIVERIQTLSQNDVKLNNRLWRKDKKHILRNQKGKENIEKTVSREKPPVSPFGILDKALNERSSMTKDDIQRLRDEVDERLKK